MRGSPPRPGIADRGIGSILSRYPDSSPARETAGAAVVIVLREDLHDVEVLLIERTERAEDPASGQVALPGGHVDPSDADLRATALRELDEEVGLDRAGLVPPVRYVGTFEAKRFSMSVGVFAAPLDPAASTTVVPNPSEVASVFWLPRTALSRRSSRTVDTAQGPIEVPSVRQAGHVVWGFTLRVLDQVLGPEAPRGSAPARA